MIVIKSYIYIDTFVVYINDKLIGYLTREEVGQLMGGN